MNVFKAIGRGFKRVFGAVWKVVSIATFPFRWIFMFFFRIFWRILVRFRLVVIGIVLGVLIVFASHTGLEYSSTDTFCDACHVHPHVTYSWKKSTHFKNKSGVVVHCTECHLPPGGPAYLIEKSRLGIRDAYATVFKDTETIDWEFKSTLEHATTYMYDSSCIHCHSDLYSLGLSPKGVEAHEYYMKNTDKLRCINCHIAVGHYREEPVEEIDYLAQEKIEVPSYPSDTGEFASYTEDILGTGVTFNMIAVPGGTFNMGSPQGESYRGEDEAGGPVKVTLSQYWIGEIEVSWREYDLFYAMTSDRGKNKGGEEPEIKPASYEEPKNVDAVTGPTPPYGSPDQGWGKGLRPAITMTHHAAVRYCEWLSKVTGKKYRLPTEAEWEYACRAGSAGPYYFEGDPKEFTLTSWKNRLFGVDTTVFDSYIWSVINSKNKTQLPYRNKPNPWGLYNMLGNVREFCGDWYAPDIYTTYSGQNVVDPKGPSSGKEHVVRGGSYTTDPSGLRSAARDHTYHDRWLMTDPQSPKSVWWYSDTKEVGFRVVREFESQ